MCYSVCLRPATLLKNRLRDRCFLMNFTKFLRILFLGVCYWYKNVQRLEPLTRLISIYRSFTFSCSFSIKANFVINSRIHTHVEKFFFLDKKAKGNDLLIFFRAIYQWPWLSFFSNFNSRKKKSNDG